MNYREVECSVRLPTEIGAYYVKMKNPIRDTIHHETFGLLDIFVWRDNDEIWINTFESWLEPYELPTIEDIRFVIHKDQEGCNLDYYAQLRIAKAIINLLRK